eukprot:gene3414-1922_t
MGDALSAALCRVVFAHHEALRDALLFARQRDPNAVFDRGRRYHRWRYVDDVLQVCDGASAVAWEAWRIPWRPPLVFKVTGRADLDFGTGEQCTLSFLDLCVTVSHGHIDSAHAGRAGVSYWRWRRPKPYDTCRWVYRGGFNCATGILRRIADANRSPKGLLRDSKGGVLQLLASGFPRNVCRRALYRCFGERWSCISVHASSLRRVVSECAVWLGGAPLPGWLYTTVWQRRRRVRYVRAYALQRHALRLRPSPLLNHSNFQLSSVLQPLPLRTRPVRVRGVY